MRSIFIPFLCLLLASCQPAPQEPAKNPMAALWGSGIISTEAPEFSTTLNRSGTEVYFNRTTPDRSSMQIMRSDKKDGNWAEATPLPFSTGAYRDIDPFLTADGNRLYFSSDRPLESDSGRQFFNTWFVERQGDDWSEPIAAGAPLNSDSTEIFISMTESGNAYFVSERDGDRGIWVCRFENGTYQAAEKVVMRLRGTPVYAGNPCIAPDESFLITAVRDPQVDAGPDLYVSWNQNGQWTELTNLGASVNSPYADFAPGLSKDGTTLYFTSERPGILPAQPEGVRPPGDIYQVDIASVLQAISAPPRQ